jgi:alpha-amylase/alpha-mannosidase (GH57 family)
MSRFVCIHGHFYQPPRENPWIEDVELQDSAYPYHDWNARVTAECYGPNSAARFLDNDRRIVDIVNNYSRISFNFGPTLLSWLERHAPETYGAVLEADRKSRDIFSGHGSAIAQCYSHLIMPLANTRDKRTQVVWGIRDFESRFKRKPEGMWLPETAVDIETLEILAGEGIVFTILAPRQAKAVRKIGAKGWDDVSGSRIDPRMPYRCRLPSKKTIVLFFYDGPVAQDIAFGGVLDSGADFANRLLSVFGRDEKAGGLAHVATDGETYGHHHHFGDLALTYCLHDIGANNSAAVTVYGEYLKKYPPSHEAAIFENSSWSCAHGIERWKNDCGCNSGGNGEWHQKWRSPLRGAMDWLRDNLAAIFEEQGAPLFKSPWAARDEYIDVVLDRTDQSQKRFLAKHAARALSPEEKMKALKLLEMQRHAMLMYTSCGWFFDDISGIETVQIMQYASRAMQLAREVSGVALEDTYATLLQRAPCNIAEYGNGEKVYELFVKPCVVDLLRVSVHYAVTSLFKEYPDTTRLYCYETKKKAYDLWETGKQKLAVGRIRIRSVITREEEEVSFVVMHLGDHNLFAAARLFRGEGAHEAMRQELKESFNTGEISNVIRLLDKHFTSANYSLWHLFRDEQRRIVDQLFASAMKEVESSFKQIYEHNAAVLQAVNSMSMPLPKVFASVAEFVMNKDIQTLFNGDELGFERIKSLAGEIKKYGLELDALTAGFVVSGRVNELMKRFQAAPGETAPLVKIIDLLKSAEALSLGLTIWEAENRYFISGKACAGKMLGKAARGDRAAKEWVALFTRVGDHLKVRVI